MVFGSLQKKTSKKRVSAHYLLFIYSTLLRMVLNNAYIYKYVKLIFPQDLCPFFYKFHSHLNLHQFLQKFVATIFNEIQFPSLRLFFYVLSNQKFNDPIKCFFIIWKHLKKHTQLVIIITNINKKDNQSYVHKNARHVSIL